LLARIDKLCRANSTLRRKNRDARLAAEETADRLEALQLEVERLQHELQRARQCSVPGKRPGATSLRKTGTGQ
jgi:HAMP domain-containing protein